MSAPGSRGAPLRSAAWHRGLGGVGSYGALTRCWGQAVTWESRRVFRTRRRGRRLNRPLMEARVPQGCCGLGVRPPWRGAAGASLGSKALGVRASRLRPRAPARPCHLSTSRLFPAVRAQLVLGPQGQLRVTSHTPGRCSGVCEHRAGWGLAPRFWPQTGPSTLPSGTPDRVSTWTPARPGGGSPVPTSQDHRLAQPWVQPWVQLWDAEAPGHRPTPPCLPWGGPFLLGSPPPTPCPCPPSGASGKGV